MLRSSAEVAEVFSRCPDSYFELSSGGGRPGWSLQRCAVQTACCESNSRCIPQLLLADLTFAGEIDQIPTEPF